MKRIRSVLRELLGLVVDDVGFAATVLGWIALLWLMSSYVPAKSVLLPFLLFAGLGIILLRAVAMRAGQGR